MPISGKGIKYLQQHGHANRDLAADFLRSHSLKFYNSHFRKPAAKKATTRKAAAKPAAKKATTTRRAAKKR